MGVSISHYDVLVLIQKKPGSETQDESQMDNLRR